MRPASPDDLVYVTPEVPTDAVVGSPTVRYDAEDAGYLSRVAVAGEPASTTFRRALRLAVEAMECRYRVRFRFRAGLGNDEVHTSGVMSPLRAQSYARMYKDAGMRDVAIIEDRDPPAPLPHGSRLALAHSELPSEGVAAALAQRPELIGQIDSPERLAPAETKARRGRR